MQTASTFLNTWFSRPVHRSRFLWFIVLIGLGIAGNILKIELFFNVDFLFGSMFALITLQFFGLLPGILAAAVISTWTIVLWNHPYAIIIQAAEVAVVGWVTTRRNIGLIAADVLYWICCGMPLVALFYMGIMHVSVHGVLLVMVKQAINGIMNALFARLIVIGFSIRHRHTPVSIRDIVQVSSFFILLVPVVALIAIESRIDSSRTDTRIQTTLRQQSKQLAYLIDLWINHRKTTICRLAKLAASENADQTGRTLQILQEADSHYDAIALTDPQGTVLLSAPDLDRTGSATTGKTLTDRPWYPIRKDIQQAMLTDVFADDRRNSASPVAAMVAPVAAGDRLLGYIEGILNLDPIRNQLEAAAFDEALSFSLIDRNGKVVFTDRPGQPAMKPIERPKGTLRRIDESIGLWLPDMPANSSIMERWKNTRYITMRLIDEVSGWRLVLEHSLGPDRKDLFDKYSQELTMLFAFLLAALALTEWLSRCSIAIFDQLCTITGRLPDRLLDGSEDPAVEPWPRSMVTESKTLIDNFDKMVRILVAKYREIQQSSDALRKRTQELWEANQSQKLEISARQKAEALLQKLLSEKEVLLREIHHRVKNNLAAIIGLIDLQSRKMSDSLHRDSMTELCARIRSMSLVHEQLYHSDNLSRIDFQAYLESLVQHIVASYEHQEDIVIHTNAQGVLMGLDEAVPCGLIVTELLTNAFKYAFPPEIACHWNRSCIVEVSAARDNDTVCLSVSDNGVGLPSDPDWAHIETLGLTLVKMLGQHQLRGKIEVDRTSGTTIRIIFPVKK
ncbi:sensor histidine kinase [Desulfatirhabdium butyrativorans]|uniref:sensor histidine kinase n=1 Tax=Desulfatirhabdium butyrativorans TaxID=340467 RepID=UPI0003F79D6D|nr:sensor histidine kinase [Desulfatirhabdium butyrativorans]